MIDFSIRFDVNLFSIRFLIGNFVFLSVFCKSHAWHCIGLHWSLWNEFNCSGMLAGDIVVLETVVGCRSMCFSFQIAVS